MTSENSRSQHEKSQTQNNLKQKSETQEKMITKKTYSFYTGRPLYNTYYFSIWLAMASHNILL